MQYCLLMRQLEITEPLEVFLCNYPCLASDCGFLQTYICPNGTNLSGAAVLPGAAL